MKNLDSIKEYYRDRKYVKNVLRDDTYNFF
jgi:hypothetical protein